VRFDGLTRGEIFGRLFGLFYGPSFVIFVLTRFARLFPAEPWSSIAAALGFVLGEAAGRALGVDRLAPLPRVVAVRTRTWAGRSG